MSYIIDIVCLSGRCITKVILQKFLHHAQMCSCAWCKNICDISFVMHLPENDHKTGHNMQEAYCSIILDTLKCLYAFVGFITVCKAEVVPLKHFIMLAFLSPYRAPSSLIRCEALTPFHQFAATFHSPIIILIRAFSVLDSMSDCFAK